MSLYANHTVWYNNGCKTGASIEAISSNTYHAVRNIDGYQAGAADKGVIPKVCHAVWDNDGC